ncbi:MAG TPA: exodeoxyribonuclease III [Rhodospirillaceae bacterium]|nr:exodeoxyribonuclease III [Rhodospirillaceae bacterium]
MLVSSWNVNSVRARLPLITGWLEKTQPDVLLLQEIKCQTEDFPALNFEALGYKTYVSGQKSYNGVAILSKKTAKDIITSLPDDDAAQARYIEATIEGVRIASIYAPNGNPLGTEKYDYKIDWMKKLKNHIKNLLSQEKPFILGGDYNVISTEKDVYDPKGWEKDALFSPQTRELWHEILHLGVTEAFRALHPEEIAYTFWDYQGGAWPRNLGLRIDHFLLSPESTDRLESCTIDSTPRAQEKASDHTPILVSLKS